MRQDDSDIFEDLELPNLIRTTLAEVSPTLAARRFHHRGLPQSDQPVRTMRNSAGGSHCAADWLT
jgi:uncharacterized sporulation protein YeaH/YhbH (DUF444 family)